ncbi:hypothetical protein CCHR01_04659 [Colletotrichum chrysophilum]|uniref:Uncharacterized protein n=1 Tax=Colletotrichum chrysophilum TaxID=1836956 RepID=A0AAD9AQD3_9PEZI|nr:hypothetical protein CCHR01_04659 [Colletotrichum chrysophilum]
MPHPRRQSQGPHVACGCPIVSLSLSGSWCLVWVRVSLESLISFSSDPNPRSAVLPRPSEVQNNGQCLAPTVFPCLCPPSRPTRLASVSQWAWLRLDLPRSYGQAPPHALDKAANIPQLRSLCVPAKHGRLLLTSPYPCRSAHADTRRRETPFTLI